MKSKFTQAELSEIQGTRLMGRINSNYEELVTAFGLPHHVQYNRTGDKSTCEWVLRFEDGTIATIYDYKTNTTPTDQYDWHVGGHSLKALDHVTNILFGIRVHEMA